MTNLKYFKLIIFICITSSTIIGCSKNVEGEILQSRVASKQLGSQLKNTLVETLQSEGPVSAIEVCNIDAIQISNNLSKKYELDVGRTSLKIRNPENKADTWETKQLKWFSSQLKSGADVKSLEVHEIVTEENKDTFRYMKAIPMQEPCALCHGKNIAPAISEKIQHLYPQDQATDYEIGEVRGAFTVKIDI